MFVEKCSERNWEREGVRRGGRAKLFIFFKSMAQLNFSENDTSIVFLFSDNNLRKIKMQKTHGYDVCELRCLLANGSCKRIWRIYEFVLLPHQER